MSAVDYNELYQEFILLTSPLSSTTSPVPSPSSSSLSIGQGDRDSGDFCYYIGDLVSSTISNACSSSSRSSSSYLSVSSRSSSSSSASSSCSSMSSSTWAMSSIQSPTTPSGPMSEPASSPHCSGVLSPSVTPPSQPYQSANSSQPSNSSYLWSPQQSQQLHQLQPSSCGGENKRKENASSPSPSISTTAPSSPPEPPAKKAAKDLNDSNNNSMAQAVTKQEVGDITPTVTSNLTSSATCIINTINAPACYSNSHQFPRASGQMLAPTSQQEGTSCVMMSKLQSTPELQKLLQAPLGHSARLPSCQEALQQHSSYIQHCFQSTSYLPPYVNCGMDGQQLHQQIPVSTSDCWMPPTPPPLNHLPPLMMHQHQLHQIQSISSMPQQQQDLLQPHNLPPRSMQSLHNHQGPPEAPLPPFRDLPSRSSSSAEPMDVKVNPSFVTDCPTFPGGLEVLWKEVPEECQKLITPHDVPEAARLRSYFVVCELIKLKRDLMARYTNMKSGVLPQHRMPHLPQSAVEAARAAAQADAILSAGVGVAVKEALDCLEDEQHQALNNHNNNNCGNGMQQMQISSYNNATSMNNSNGNSSNTGIHPTESNLVGNGKENMAAGPSDLKSGIAGPPLRTNNLVLKLLQIGDYCFRSFIESSPNRLRVLFTAQRFSYECHLPMVQDNDMLYRKILIIDVNFDQIKKIQFGVDHICLLVDGTPVMSVTYNRAVPEEMPQAMTFSPNDLKLLEEIDKGLLKLDAIHKLFCINERLVYSLESQLREHPRFRHLLAHQIPLQQPGR